MADLPLTQQLAEMSTIVWRVFRRRPWLACLPLLVFVNIAGGLKDYIQEAIDEEPRDG